MGRPVLLYDSHNHLQDEKLQAIAGELPTLVREEGIGRMVVNGTREEDWAAVRRLASDDPVVLPSFGLHPWYLAQRTPAWQDRLCRHLDEGPAAIGEIGLDRWMRGYDLPEQERVFRYQLGLAVDRGLPVSIHCLRAWGRLFDLLRAGPRPAKGMLLHSYGGPLEMIQPFVELGAYFSLSGHFAHAGKERQREVFRNVPIDRFLIETDAPDMLPPESWIRRPLPVKGVNHPGNLAGVYAFAAELRGEPIERLAEQVETNFLRLFGKS